MKKKKRTKKNNSLIRLSNIYKIYKNDESVQEANSNVSLSINKGELVSIVGPSGSGKSTLMNIIGCLSTPTSGTYILDGLEVQKLDENKLSVIRNKEIGFIFQKYNLINKLTIKENVELPLIYKKVHKKEREQIVDEMLNKVGIIEKKNKYPTQLSGGESQRVAIARALATNPNIILADEPTGALDSKNGRMVLDIIKGLNNEGKTVIIVTHDISIANECNRMIQMMDGKIISDKEVIR